VHELDPDAAGILDERGVVVLAEPLVDLGLSHHGPSGVDGDRVQTVDLVARVDREREMLPPDASVHVRAAGVVARGEDDQLGLLAVVPRDRMIVFRPALVPECRQHRVELRPPMLEIVDGDAQVIEKRVLDMLERIKDKGEGIKKKLRIATSFS